MYTSPLLKAQAAITHGFSDVHDGNMDFRFGDHDTVLADRTKFLGAAGLTPDQCVQQFGMGDGIRVVTSADAGRGMRSLEGRIEASAFITNEPGIGLFLAIADCLPIIIFDPARKVIALLHASRPATNLLLTTQVVDRLGSKFHCDPKDLLVAFGPAVRAESYIFDDNIYKLVTPAWQPYLKRLGPNQTSVDLIAYNRHQLTAAGVPEANIADSAIDTGHDPNYFSHVHALHAHQPEGRLAAVVALR